MASSSTTSIPSKRPSDASSPVEVVIMLMMMMFMMMMFMMMMRVMMMRVMVMMTMKVNIHDGHGGDED
jgi:hypothetical protein